MQLDDFISEYRTQRFADGWPEIRTANCVDTEDGLLLEYPYLSLRLYWLKSDEMNLELWLPNTRSKYRHEILSVNQLFRIVSSQAPKAIEEWFSEYQIQETEKESEDLSDDDHMAFLQDELVDWFISFIHDTSGAPETFWRDWLMTAPPQIDPEDWTVESGFMGSGTRNQTKTKTKKNKKNKDSGSARKSGQDFDDD